MIKNPITTLYEERAKFIIIGLTGRTGSGCTTVARILQTKNFRDLNLKEPKTTNFESNDERKYQIIYSYAKENWQSFEKLSMTDIIISFIVKYKIDKLKDLFESIFDEDKDLCVAIYSKLKEYTDEQKTLSFIKCYEEINERINRCLDKNATSLKRNSDNHGSREDYLREEYSLLQQISIIQDIFKKVLASHTYRYTIKTKKGDSVQEKKLVANVYTYFLQKVGNNIRNNGDAFSSEFTGEHMFALARRANDFIKAVRFVNNVNQKNTLICLDAIRNPYEATYFQDRYSAFYLVTVNTDDEERKRRLGESNLKKDQIESLDDIEYPSALKGEQEFTNQNIGACSQLGDIHIYNRREFTSEKYFVTELIVKYITLIRHPGLITPTHIEMCMQVAYNAKLNSGCLSRQVGAVITDSNYSIKAVGWNSVAEGQVPCNLRSLDNYINNKDYSSFSRYEIEDEEFNRFIKEKHQAIKHSIPKLKGRLYPYCFKDFYSDLKGDKNQVHTRSLHAEENAFLQIVKYGGEGIKGGTLFTTASSCVLCSKKAYQLGIKDIYYVDPYPDIAVSHILSFGVNKERNPQTHLFYGAIGKAYTNLYTQRIAIKDELDMLLK